MIRTRWANILAFVGLAAAFIAAIGPAAHVATTYTWPPEKLPDARPNSVWYTPLLLMRRQPEEMVARIPCVLPPALPGAEQPMTVLATARSPERVGGLSVTRVRDRLVIAVGRDTVTRAVLRGGLGLDGTCTYRLSFGDGRWLLDGGPNGQSRGGALDFMPVVNGFFSSLDLRAGTPFSVKVTTSTHATRARAFQTVGWIFAVLCAVTSLLLVAIVRRPRPLETAVESLRDAFASARPVDALVVLLLLVWWVIGPAGFDDGWVVARQSMFSSAGGFSNYYDSFGSDHPLGYWLEWLQHWLPQETAQVIVLRVPVLLVLATTWVVCRWTLSRVLPPGSRDRVVLWALASAFLVGAYAGGMTLRPEPEVALLASGVLLCATYFVERESAAPLAVAATLVVLALAAHPAGVVTSAPLIVCLPRLARWARSNIAAAASIGTAVGALLVVLTFVSSDLEQRRLERETIRVYGNANASWRDEINRYSGLFLEQYGSPLRREAVAFLGLSVVAYLLRKHRREKPLLDLPAAGIAVALLLLTLTPSKWPWHFAALLGVASVAVATETARLREDARGSRGWSVRPFIIIGAAILAIAWSWTPRHIWNHLDIQTLHWTLGIEERGLPFSALAAAAPLLLLIGVGLFELARRGRHSLGQVPWRLAVWSAALMAAPLLAFTAVVLVVDAAKTNSWTLTRQNLSALEGQADCGLAESGAVPVSGSMTSLKPLQRADTGLPLASWVPPAPIGGLTRFALGPAQLEVPARTPWFSVLGSSKIGVLVAGRSDPAASLVLEWGRRRGAQIQTLARFSIRAFLAPDLQSEYMSWRFFAGVDLPSRPPEADAVRLALYTSVPTGSSIAVSTVSYSDERLVRRLTSATSRTLVAPNLLMYTPCARLPRVHDGVFEVPDSIVALRDWEHPIFGRSTTPYAGVFDLYRLYRLPLTYSQHPPKSVVVYEFDRRIPGAAQVQPEEHTFTS